MEYEHQLSKLVYEYLVDRFRFGYYQYGDSLPTVEAFCSQFNVSVHTIWAALRRLRTEGYIDMKNGRTTKVIYKQTEQERKDLIVRYFSERWLANIDLYQATELLYIPVLVEGFRRMDETDIGFITRLAEHADREDHILFYSFVLQKINNPLLMNLFWETSLFLGYPFAKNGYRPFAYNAESGRRQLNALVQFVKEGNWARVRSQLQRHHWKVIDNLKRNMGTQLRTVPKEMQKSFVWRVYNDYPQGCYDLASRLLYEIYMGEYRKTEFLPSYEKLSEKYRVSVSTVRRTVRMTNRMGATQSVNGKGTRIIGPGESPMQPDFTCHAIRRSLSCLIQSLELLLYTCETVSCQFFRNLLPEEREALLTRFEENQRSGSGKLSIYTYLHFVTQYSRIQAIREIYGTIYGLFLWGYPLRDSLETEDAMVQRGMDFTASMICYMKKNDVSHCVQTIREYLEEQLPVGTRYLERHGISAEDLKGTPSLRLMIAEE